MTRNVVLAGALLAAVSEARDAAESQATPIGKVLSMMEDMKAKGIAEKEAEATKYATFAQWCTDQVRVKKDEISAAGGKMEGLTADIEEAASELKNLEARIKELEEDVSRWTQDKKAASGVREKEALDFKATSLDYSESIDAISGAMTVLKKQQGATPQASALVQASFLQVSRRDIVPDDVKTALSSYLQQGETSTDDATAQGPGDVAAYSSQSGGVLDMLATLSDEFAAKKTELEKQELTSQHGFEQIMQQLTDNIETASQEIERKTKRSAETAKNKKTAEGDLAQTKNDSEEDQTYLEETNVLCEQKAGDFKSRQELRAGEIDALSQAIEIVGSSSVKGAGEKNLPQLVQQAATAFAQLRSTASRTLDRSPLQARAAAFLADRAHASGSRVLSEASDKVAGNPFGKVKKLIKDLISKLMEEGTSETEHKGWCDAELGANKITRDERTSDAEQLNSEIEDFNANIAQLTQDIADLSAACKELETAMASTTEERQANQAANEQTIAEAKEAQTAVEDAMAVLKEFYAKAADATALVQQTQGAAHAQAPETFDKPYTGMGAEGGNVVDFLEVILTDFARLESETSAQESEEASEYDKFMFESKKDKTLKEKESELKTQTITEQEQALHTAEAELKTVQEQLDKAQAYYEKLKPDCVDSGANYDDRKKQREEEITSLQEALDILAGQSLPTME